MRFWRRFTKELHKVREHLGILGNPREKEKNLDILWMPGMLWYENLQSTDFQADKIFPNTNSTKMVLILESTKKNVWENV